MQGLRGLLSALLVAGAACAAPAVVPHRPFGETVFATRNTVSDGHWYANVGYYYSGRPAYGTQGRLCAWNVRIGSLRLLSDDPGYRPRLAMIDAGRQRLDEIKRFDMTGLKPRPEYLREMKRYGALPEAFDPDRAPVDVYALDRRYWDSFIYSPPPLKAAP